MPVTNCLFKLYIACEKWHWISGVHTPYLMQFSSLKIGQLMSHRHGSPDGTKKDCTLKEKDMDSNSKVYFYFIKNWMVILFCC